MIDWEGLLKYLQVGKFIQIIDGIYGLQWDGFVMGVDYIPYDPRIDFISQEKHENEYQYALRIQPLNHIEQKTVTCLPYCLLMINGQWKTFDEAMTV